MQICPWCRNPPQAAASVAKSQYDQQIFTAQFHHRLFEIPAGFFGNNPPYLG